MRILCVLGLLFAVIEVSSIFVSGWFFFEQLLIDTPLEDAAGNSFWIMIAMLLFAYPAKFFRCSQ